MQIALSTRGTWPRSPAAGLGRRRAAPLAGSATGSPPGSLPRRQALGPRGTWPRSPAAGLGRRQAAPLAGSATGSPPGSLPRRQALGYRGFCFLNFYYY